MATIESIDQAIAAADADFASLSGKLLGVQDDMQYQAVTGTGGFKDPQLTGETQKVVAGVLTLMSGLWVVANLVAKRIEEARTKRAGLKGGLFGSSGSSLKEVEELLSAHTLSLTPEAAAKLPEVIKGRLFTQQTNLTSVQVALAALGDLLKQAALSIIQVEECKNGLKQHIAEVEKRLEDVLPIVTKVGGSAQLAHRNAVSAVASLKGSYEFDPLGVNRSFDSMVDQHVNTINRAIDSVQKAKEKAYAEYGDAQVLMQRLEDRQPNPTRTPELRDWLNKLVKRLEQEDWSAASSGLEDWIREANGVLSSKSTTAPASNPGHSSTPAHGNPPPSAPVVHQPPASYPPAYTAPPPPVRVEQLPVSGNYTKYTPPEKSNLEKLLDGELKPAAPPPAPAVEQHPVDPALDKLVSSRTSPSGPPPTSVGTAPNPGLDKLVNGPAKQPTTSPSASTPASPPNNAALDDLLNGRPKKPAPPAGQTQAGQPAVTPTTVPPPVANSGNSALGDLIEGRKKPTPPPSTNSTGGPVVSSTQTAATVSTPVSKPAPTPTPAVTTSSASEAAKLADMFGGKKPAPPSVPAAPGAAASTATNGGAKPALSQAEQDEAARKALEKLLKG
jgi:hypothetical protein